MDLCKPPKDPLPITFIESKESLDSSLFIFLLPKSKELISLPLPMLSTLLLEILDFLEFNLEERLNLLLLDADPNIRSSHDFSLWSENMSLFYDIFLSGVECKLLVS